MKDYLHHICNFSHIQLRAWEEMAVRTADVSGRVQNVGRRFAGCGAGGSAAMITMQCDLYIYIYIIYICIYIIHNIYLYMYI
jgi:hypothetical protein